MTMADANDEGLHVIMPNMLPHIPILSNVPVPNLSHLPNIPISSIPIPNVPKAFNNTLAVASSRPEPAKAFNNVSNFPRPDSSVLNSQPSPLSSKRRDKQRDWNIIELRKLIAAKKHQWELIKAGTSLQRKIAQGKQKWKQVAEFILREGVSAPIRDHGSCKRRWENLSKDFRKIYEYEKGLPSEVVSYFEMGSSEHKRLGLPSVFPEELYIDMVDWFPYRAEPINDAEPGAMDSVKLQPQASASTHTSLHDEDIPQPDNGVPHDMEDITKGADAADTPQEDTDTPVSSGPSSTLDRRRGKRKRSNGGLDARVELTKQIVDALREGEMRRDQRHELSLQFQRDQVDKIVAVLDRQANSMKAVAEALMMFVASQHTSSSSQ